ncbi:MAG: PIN domain containing protein VapC [Candidatus Methanohalarchaeum thermophilum]|uniref:PIN domain containing protein VapC n=1 Tax=Methanohalarchaeum thermophilum TaxID=1903181 RepID=A0A1Q6DU52_METT1|nr:MAG: PIN domain containing protein VapC [Candidatus Methanohalarchaeum thermophilum]
MALRVVLDTNVLVSSFLGTGPPDKLMNKIEEREIISVTSLEIIEELKDVLDRDKIPVNEKEKELFLDRFLLLSEVVDPFDIDLDVVEEDQDDNKFLECALKGDCSYLVSGDSHLLDLKEFKGIKILDPRGFLEKTKKD